VTEVRELTELITPGPAQALAGLLGVPLADGALPLLWHGRTVRFRICAC
jgi:hypothetical protein